MVFCCFPAVYQSKLVDARCSRVSDGGRADGVTDFPCHCYVFPAADMEARQPLQPLETLSSAVCSYISKVGFFPLSVSVCNVSKTGRFGGSDTRLGSGLEGNQSGLTTVCSTRLNACYSATVLGEFSCQIEV